MNRFQDFSTYGIIVTAWSVDCTRSMTIHRLIYIQSELIYVHITGCAVPYVLSSQDEVRWALGSSLQAAGHAPS